MHKNNTLLVKWAFALLILTVWSSVSWAACPPQLYDVTGGGSYCGTGPGFAIQLNGSEVGVKYKLYLNTNFTGQVIIGTGAPIAFANQTSLGTYTIESEDTVNICTSFMNGQADIVATPAFASYTVSGGGVYCLNGTGVSVQLPGSELGYFYQLHRNGQYTGVSLAGTNAALNFSNVTAVGNYSIIVYDSLGGCSDLMNDSVQVATDTIPFAYTVTGGGNYCTGTPAPAIALSGSEPSVKYSLLFNTVPQLPILTGTGNSLNFGVQAATGDYSVMGIDTITGCMNLMQDTIQVFEVLNLGTAGSISGPASICVGTTPETYTIPPVSNASNYLWTLPAGATLASGQGTNSIVVIWGASLGGTIQVDISNLCFNIAPVTTTASVSNLAPASINPVPPTCINTTPFNVLAVNAGGVWRGAGISDTINGTFNPALVGIGTTRVFYKITGGGCVKEDSINIVVNGLPDASYTGTTSYCASSISDTLTPVNAGGTWSGAGVNPTTGEFIPFNAGAGTHPITYTFTDANNCTASTTQNFTVIATPQVSFAPVAAPCNLAAPFNLTATPAGGVWSGTGITNAGAGTFDASIVGPNNTASIQYNVSVNGCPGVGLLQFPVTSFLSVAFTAPNSLCANSTPVQLVPADTGGVFSGTGVTPGGLFDPSVAGFGSVTVTYSIGQGNCFNTGSTQIGVVPIVNPVITPIASPCANGTAANLVANIPGGTWSGDGITDIFNGTLDPVQVTGDTAFIVYSVVANGCIGADTLALPIRPVPDASFVSPDPICIVNGVVNLTPINAGGTFSGTGVTAGGQFNPAVFAPSGSSTNINYTVTVNGCTGTATQSVVALPDPVGAFTSSLTGYTLTLTAATSFGANILWDFGDGTSGTGTPATHTYPQPGTYRVVLTAYNACDSATLAQEITVVGIGVQNQDAPTVEVFPNPASTFIGIRSATPMHVSALQLFDITGKLVYVHSQEVQLESGTPMLVPVEQLTPGVYFIRIVDGQNRSIQHTFLKH